MYICIQTTRLERRIVGCAPSGRVSSNVEHTNSAKPVNALAVWLSSCSGVAYKSS